LKDYRGHRPKLVDSVTKRLECEMCGVSWLRGRPPLGPCRGVSRDKLLDFETPALGVQTALVDGIYRGRAKAGT
jgi:hypothetical protein